MSNEIVPHNLPAGQWEMIREDIMHPRDRQRCDLIRDCRTGTYVTTDGDSLRSIDQAAAAAIAAQPKQAVRSAPAT